MKPLSTFIALVLFITTYAQDRYNFTAHNSQLHYNVVISQDLTPQQMLSYLQKKIKHTTSPSIKNGVISGTSDYRELFTDKSGLAVGVRKPATFNYVIEFKQGRYRVSVRNIAFKGTEVEIYGVTDTTDFALESLCIKKKDGSIRTNKMTDRTLSRLDESLQDLFTYKPADDNW